MAIPTQKGVTHTVVLLVNSEMDIRKKHLTLIFLLIMSLLSDVHGTSVEHSSTECLPPRKHFVLIHGACHGAWSWYKIVALLKSSGHNVTAIDFAASGIDPRAANPLRSISDYHRPFLDFMASLASDQKVILVGHSLGGLAISQAMEWFPDKIYVAIFVAALMPGPALNISTLNKESFGRMGSLLDSRYAYDDGPNNPPTTLVFGPLFLKSNVYQLSPIEDWTLATALMRPLRLFDEEDLSKQLVLTNERYGSVNRVFVIAEEDEVGKKDFQLWNIERNPPHEVVEILGSDHMVMMSKPRELWARLLHIASKYDKHHITPLF